MHATKRSLFGRRPIATGLALGAVALVPHLFLPPAMSLAFASILLGIVAGVYFGFAVSAGTTQQQLTELGVACCFGMAAFIGFAAEPRVLPAAYGLHAAWDLAHHNRSRLRLVAIPQWYVPWCVSIDLVVAIGLSLLWLWRGAV